MKRFMSSNGTIFQNRISAIKYMIDNHFEKSEIEKMCSLLKKQDGWESDENLPQGWMKKRTLSATIYLSPTWETFRSKHHVLKDMKNNGYDEKVIQKTEKYLYTSGQIKELLKKGNKREPLMDEAYPSSQKKIKLDKEVLDWKPDSTLPSGWLTAHDSNNKVLISNSQGDTFSSRIEAIGSMISNQQSPEEIYQMWSGLHVEGWFCDEVNLPAGWRRKQITHAIKSYNYLSPLMEVIKSSEALLEHMEKSKDYSSEEIKNVKLWIEN